MPNSADKSPQNPANLSEDSDVIELTEEIGARKAASAALLANHASEPSDLDFEIPEFRLPGAGVEPALADDDSEPELATQRLSSLDSSALSSAPHGFSAQPVTQPVTQPAPQAATQPASQPMHLSDDDIDLPDDFDSTMLVEAHSEPIEELPADVAEDVFDRQEMVKTIQLQAVDRAVLERELEIETVARATLITDQRFSPDVLIAPPRVLAKRWMEGSPLSEQTRTTAQHTKAPPRPQSGAFQRPEIEDEQVPEIEFEPEYEDVPTAVAPAPRPQAPSGVQPRVPPRPAPQTPAPVQQAPAQQAHAQQAPVQQRPAPKQGEMSDLVSELLEESKPAKPADKTPRPSARDTWAQTVFTEEYLRTLPRDLERISERDVDFIDASLSLQSGSRILDLACGIGRHAMIMARRGYEVAGMDLSMPLLQIALNEAQKRSIPVKFVHGDMRSMNFQSIFDGCYSWQTSFGYFDDPTNFKVLQGVNRALKPGGRFLLDVINRDYIVGEMPNRAWWEGKECIFLEEVDFDNTQSVLHTKRSYIYEDGTPPLEHNFYIRLYSLHELLNLMQGAGFRVLEVSGELGQRTHFLGASSTRLLILAERPIK